jgi:putative hydrolase of HD superfamily
MSFKKITNFIFELGHLRKLKTTGWALTGVTTPPSIAEHTLRAGQIGYILAKLENANPEKVVVMLIMHDNAEARTGDQNKVSAKYFDKKEGEKLAFREQIAGLGEDIEKKLLKNFNEFENRNTKEGIIAKDADWLEMAFQAKEYIDLGYKSAQDWINNIEKAVETDSAKKIIQELKSTKFTDWWKNLKKMTYKKL